MYFRTCLADAKTVFDVGANFGLMSTLFAKFSNGADIWCFEPAPDTAAALRRNLLFNSAQNTRVIPSAVGASVGTIGFSIGSDPATNSVARDATTGIEVPVTTIDHFAQKHEICSIDFLKIDVEGAEVDVLMGARDMLSSKRIKQGLIEICPANLARFGRAVADVVYALESHDYRLFYLDKGKTSRDFHAEDVSDQSLCNAGFEPR